MTPERTILLGRITRVHGFEGAVTVKLEKQFTEDISGMESVFLEIEGKQVPFFIDYTEPAGKGFIRMKFDGYDSAGEVHEFRGCSVMAAGNWEHKEDTGHSIRDLIGFEVNPGTIPLGRISDIIENPGQLLLDVENNSGKRILIPFHEDLIVEINLDLRTVTMIIPEGLTEVN